MRRPARDLRKLRDLRAFLEVLAEAPAQVPDLEQAWRAVRDMHDVLHPTRARTELGLVAVVELVRAVAEPGDFWQWPPYLDLTASAQAKRVAWLVKELERRVHPAFASLAQQQQRVAEVLASYTPTRRKGHRVPASIAAELTVMAGAWGEHKKTAAQVVRVVEAAIRKHAR
jgi:hypothetical protein